MRVRPRWLVACSVVGALLASGATVLVLPQHVAPVEVVELPSFAPAPPLPEPVGAGPAVTGRQIADLAAGPARRRAEELARTAAPRATTQPAPSVLPTVEAEEGRDRIKKACKEGRMTGRVCRGR